MVQSTTATENQTFHMQFYAIVMYENSFQIDIEYYRTFDNALESLKYLCSIQQKCENIHCRGGHKCENDFSNSCDILEFPIIESRDDFVMWYYENSDETKYCIQKRDTDITFDD